MQKQVLTAPEFGVVKPQGFYTVKGVWLPYAQAYRDVQVTTDLLNDGRPGTQSELAKTWWLGSAPLITALLASLYVNKDGAGVEELRNLFSGDFRNNLMMTSTSVSYRPSGLDSVAHDAGTPEQRTLEARMTGPDGYLNDKMSEEIQALLGNGNVGEVRAVYSWVTGKESYLVRFNSRPKQNVWRVLVLGDFFSGDFGIDAGNINYVRPARGVRVAPQSSIGNKG